MSKDFDALLPVLRQRFLENMERHQGLDWADVEKQLKANEKAQAALLWMEETGGEVDALVHPAFGEGLVYVDCSPESPSGRRSVCYDALALEKRKENKPWHSALGLAEEKGVKVLSEAQYRALQSLMPLDNKTSSWVTTPQEVRKLGGGYFMNRHYGQVFLYYNGVESYYAARGFRAFIAL